MKQKIDYENQIETTLLNLFNKLQTSITFANIINEFEKNNIDVSGEWSWEKNNMIIWCYINKTLINTLKKMLTDNIIDIEPCTPIFYMVDGRMLNFPIAKQLYHKYKHPHWCPVHFHLNKNNRKVV